MRSRRTASPGRPAASTCRPRDPALRVRKAPETGPFVIWGAGALTSARDTSAPPAGVLHTIEGNLESGIGVFRQHFAPHFALDGGQIVQLLPLGVRLRLREPGRRR